MKITPEFIATLTEVQETINEIVNLPHSGTYNDDISIKFDEDGVCHCSVDRWYDGEYRDNKDLYLTWEELGKDDPIEYFTKKFNDEFDALQLKLKLEIEKKKAADLADRKRREQLLKDKDYEIFQELQKKFSGI